MRAKATSPASSGPAGSYFEGQVGAHYLLAMLAGTAPRGLPSMIIDRIEFQRANEGHPLDDIIVHTHDNDANSAVLEIQVKRTISFSRNDSAFRDVMKQIAEVSQKPDFTTLRYELAIATAKASHKIDAAYQDVLTWARQLGNAETFMNRVDRRGAASEDMRTLVATFKSH